MKIEELRRLTVYFVFSEFIILDLTIFSRLRPEGLSFKSSAMFPYGNTKECHLSSLLKILSIS